LDFEVCGFGFLFARGFLPLNHKEKAATPPKITTFRKPRVATTRKP
jgi:hypothetical protein